jgi:hypothetical protein
MKHIIMYAIKADKTYCVWLKGKEVTLKPTKKKLVLPH